MTPRMLILMVVPMITRLLPRGLRGITRAVLRLSLLAAGGVALGGFLGIGPDLSSALAWAQETTGSLFPDSPAPDGATPGADTRSDGPVPRHPLIRTVGVLMLLSAAWMLAGLVLRIAYVGLIGLGGLMALGTVSPAMINNTVTSALESAEMGDNAFIDTISQGAQELIRALGITAIVTRDADPASPKSQGSGIEP